MKSDASVLKIRLSAEEHQELKEEVFKVLFLKLVSLKTIR